jgi:hypothetical protein
MEEQCPFARQRFRTLQTMHTDGHAVEDDGACDWVRPHRRVSPRSRAILCDAIQGVNRVYPLERTRGLLRICAMIVLLEHPSHRDCPRRS